MLPVFDQIRNPATPRCITIPVCRRWLQYHATTGSFSRWTIMPFCIQVYYLPKLYRYKHSSRATVFIFCHSQSYSVRVICV